MPKIQRHQISLMLQSAPCCKRPHKYSAFNQLALCLFSGIVDSDLVLEIIMTVDRLTLLGLKYSHGRESERGRDKGEGEGEVERNGRGRGKRKEEDREREKEGGVGGWCVKGGGA